MIERSHRIGTQIGRIGTLCTLYNPSIELIEIARDGDDPKAELIRLIMGQACGVQPLQRPIKQMIVSCPAEICTGYGARTLGGTPRGYAVPPGASMNVTGPDGRVYNVAVPAGMQA